MLESNPLESRISLLVRRLAVLQSTEPPPPHRSRDVPAQREAEGAARADQRPRVRFAAAEVEEEVDRSCSASGKVAILLTAYVPD